MAVISTTDIASSSNEKLAMPRGVRLSLCVSPDLDRSVSDSTPAAKGTEHIRRLETHFLSESNKTF